MKFVKSLKEYGWALIVLTGFMIELLQPNSVFSRENLLLTKSSFFNKPKVEANSQGDVEMSYVFSSPEQQPTTPLNLDLNLYFSEGSSHIHPSVNLRVNVLPLHSSPDTRQVF